MSYLKEDILEPGEVPVDNNFEPMDKLLAEEYERIEKLMEQESSPDEQKIEEEMCEEEYISNYGDHLQQDEQNECIDSVRSGESIIKNYLFDNTKYNYNTKKCIAFWKAIKERPHLKPCPCQPLKRREKKVKFNIEGEESETASAEPPDTWYDTLEMLQKKKLDQVAFAATFQSCKLCERDEPYAKFKRKMGRNYSDTELKDYEDLTCLNCWISKSIVKPDPKKVVDSDVTKVIFINSCVCDEEKCVCCHEEEGSTVTQVSYLDITNSDTTYFDRDNINSIGMCPESGEGDFLNVNQQKKRSTSYPKETEAENLLKMHNPSVAPSIVLLEEDDEINPVKETNSRHFSIQSSYSNVSEEGTVPPLIREDPSLGSSAPQPSKSPADMMHATFKPGCCYGCGILGCVCNICKPVTPKEIPQPVDRVEETLTTSKSRKTTVDDLDKFLNQCEQCGMDCKCWKNKVDNAKQYLEDLKQILKTNISYDKACGTRDSEEDIVSDSSAKVCIICGHRDCNCKYAHGRPSAYFQTFEFGKSVPQTTTFAKIHHDKIKNDESRSFDGLDNAKREPSGVDLTMEKLKNMSLKHQQEKPIIKDCKNKLMVTPEQKAKSIIKNNVNLVIQDDLYGVPHVIRYPDKRPVQEPCEDEESYGSLTESSDGSTEMVHDLEPWFCTERPKEEKPEITYGRKL